eukprot:TRINITY_DN46533_c0_g1_i2.p1 TRINITY_DN46533_c0_g1~~TRINITY_DN46533_c0_g1_i2.p1  ORF type:complete len:133 (-),score=13.83 TRINITY_DN46533_c0_g1_i2:137-535(-)
MQKLLDLCILLSLDALDVADHTRAQQPDVVPPLLCLVDQNPESLYSLVRHLAILQLSLPPLLAFSQLFVARRCVFSRPHAVLYSLKHAKQVLELSCLLVEMTRHILELAHHLAECVFDLPVLTAEQVRLHGH